MPAKRRCARLLIKRKPWFTLCVHGSLPTGGESGELGWLKFGKEGENKARLRGTIAVHRVLRTKIEAAAIEIKLADIKTAKAKIAIATSTIKTGKIKIAKGKIVIAISTIRTAVIKIAKDKIVIAISKMITGVLKTDKGKIAIAASTIEIEAVVSRIAKVRIATVISMIAVALVQIPKMKNAPHVLKAIKSHPLKSETCWSSAEIQLCRISNACAWMKKTPSKLNR